MARVRIRRIARQEGVDPPLLRALIRQESGNNPNARSPAGAIGRTQLMPATARGLGVNPYNDRQNVRGGARYLRQQLDRFGGDTRKALAAYNAGPGAVQKYGGVPPYAETQNYVRSILSNYRGRGRTSRRGGGSLPALRGPDRVDVERRTSFDRAGFEQATQRARVGEFLASRGRGDSILFRSGLLSTEQPAREDFTSSRLVSRVVRGKPVSAPAAGGSRVRGSSQAGQLDELFFDPLGGWDRPKGSKKIVSIGAIGGHGGHAHVGGDPELMLRLGRSAKRMGLGVRENPAFDPVDPVHTKGSLHYKSGRVRTKRGKRKVGKAIDVSGDPQMVTAFVRKVAREFNLR